MPLSVGDKIGHYEVISLLGQGGMGEVYRARDTKLKREVAVKVLPEAFARDPERMSRFQREAEVLASLNHPNIATIHGVEDRALVMELVEGNSPNGPLPFDEAWKIASQIAAALEYAHERGIMHRDLKPANIIVTPDGVVKLLDFGLAKAFSNQKEPSTSSENSPTLTLGATEVGVILGTAAYMAPEQARGKAVDKRADIWSFGVVLYELLTGERLFTGEDAAETLAAVIHKQPDLGKVPQQARRLLEECLQKDPRQRLRDIGDAKRLLGGESPVEPAVTTTPSRYRLGWLWPGVAALFALSAGAVSFLHFRETPPEPQLLRTAIDPPPGVKFDFPNGVGLPAISPDGKKIVFGAATADGKNPLWVRPLDGLAAQPLTGTDGASFPFWSPDSRSIAFFAEAKLKRIDATGGPVLTLADAPNGRGGSWGASGDILFDPGASSLTLMRIPAVGGTVAAALKEPGSFPWFLPDGTHFLFQSPLANDGNRTIKVASLGDPAVKSLRTAPTNAIYSQGHILFVLQGTLMAQPFDTEKLALTGDAVPVAERTQTVLGTGRAAAASVSAGGLLLYSQGAGDAGYALAWYDRAGKRLNQVAGVSSQSNVRLSPDQKRAAGNVVGTQGGDVWVYDLLRPLKTRLTFGASLDTNPVWSPDGRTIAFRFRKKAFADLYRHAADGSGTDELLYADEKGKRPTAWSPDGKYLLFDNGGTFEPFVVFALPLTSEKPGQPLKPIQVIRGLNATFSPDGRWIAFQQRESGLTQIYVTPFPPKVGSEGSRRQVSTNGGTDPVWRGREIFYVTQTEAGRLHAVEVTETPNSIEIGADKTLPFGPISTSQGWFGDVSADGQRFLLRDTGDETHIAEPLVLIQNWTAALKK